MSWQIALNTAISGGGFSMTEAQVLEASRALEDALTKSTTGVNGIGYQTPPGMDAGADLSPLLTQSIDAALATATTYNEEDFVVWDMIPKDTAKQTMHEIRRHRTHGNKFLDLAAAEGSAGINDYSTFEPDFVNIKFWTTRRELTYVAANIPGQATLVSGSMLALQTKEAVLQLRRRLEIDTMWGDSNLSSLQTDGLIKQIEDDGYYEDLDGEQLTFDRIERKLTEIGNVDIGARPTHMLVTPNQWTDLSRQAQEGAGRFQSEGIINGRNFTYGSTGLFVFSPNSNRKIEVKKAPFLDIERAYGSPFNPGTSTPVDRYSPTNAAPTDPVVKGGGDAPAAAVNASSKFKAADVGSYRYYIMGINPNGHSAPVPTIAVPVAAGESVTVKLDVPAVKPLYYHVFRTDKTGVLATAKYLTSFKHVETGGPPTDTVTFVDHNAVKRSSSRALLVNFSGPEELAFYRLLPLARIPLAQTDLKIPFTVFMSGAVKAKVPEKQFIWKNCGVAAPV